MNYQKHYDQLIESRKINYTIADCHEKHHIVPKCMNGSNEQENLVLLTAREHYIAHWLLTKIYPENVSLKYAFCCMQWDKNRRKLTSKQFERLKNLKSETHKNFNHSEESKRKIGEAQKGKIVSEETRKKMSQARKGKKIKPFSEETRKKMSNSHIGLRPSEETRKKLSEWQIGKKLSDETKQKLREKALGRKLSEEHKRKISESRKNNRSTN